MELVIFVFPVLRINVWERAEKGSKRVERARD